MSGFLNKIFKKKQVVDMAQIERNAKASFELAQLDKKLLAEMLKDPDKYTEYLLFLSNELIIKEKETRSIDAEFDSIRRYLDAYIRSSEQQIYYKDDYTCDDPSQELPAFILFPLIQNALYWGYNNYEKHPIRIRLRLSEGFLRLEVSNRVNHYIANQQDTVLIDCYKARLELLFGNRYTLIMNSNTNNFKATLMIQLVDKG